MSDLFDVGTWTHAALVERASRWLRNGAVIPCNYGKSRRRQVRCPVVLAERQGEESADVIGWFCSGRLSILVECKASRADFHSDKNKRFRRHPEQGMGSYRYYFAPHGILSAADMPDRWGLLLVDGRTVRVAKVADMFHERNWRTEIGLVVSELTRYQFVLNGGTPANMTRPYAEVTACLAALTTLPPSA